MIVALSERLGSGWRFRRMHLALKKEATKPAARNLLQQQGRFEKFIRCFNQERPHEALNMRYPAELYSPSLRPYQGIRELEYPYVIGMNLR